MALNQVKDYYVIHRMYSSIKNNIYYLSIHASTEVSQL